MAYTKVTGALVGSLSDLDLTNVGDIQLDSISGDGDTNTSITFSGSDVITVTTGGDTQFTFNNGSILPTTDNDIDLGSSSYEFKDGYFDGTVYADAVDLAGTTLVSSPITAVNNATANELVTIGSTTTELDAEANLTFDGTILGVGNANVADATILIDSASGGDPTLIFDTSAANRTGIINYKDQGTVSGFIKYEHNGNKLNLGSGSASTVTLCVNDGKVGVNTTTPDASLHNEASAVTNVHYDTAASTVLEATENVVQITAADSGSNATALLLSNAPSSGDNKHWIFHHGGTSKSNRLDIGYGTSSSTGFDGRGDIAADLSIDVSGNFCVGTTSPAGKVTFNHDGDVGIWFQNDGTTKWNITNDTSGSPGGDSLWIGDHANDNGVYISNNGSSWQGISDERLKRNWTTLTGACDKLDTLTKVGTFERRGKTTGNWSSDKEVGLSAQEVEAILPEAVHTGEDIEFASDDKVTAVKGMSYEKLVPLLIKAIQELNTRLKAVE
tara:strand:- start:9247 stop:10749 length:1503 start_codon:yes stop_codon:yes gene_type:complete